MSSMLIYTAEGPVVMRNVGEHEWNHLYKCARCGVRAEAVACYQAGRSCWMPTREKPA